MILLKLDPADRTPMFRQIVEQVRGLIDRESLRPGQAMPATRRLAEDLGVHRTTVYKAYEELWALGYLESTPGSYTRVRWRPRPEAATERQNRPAPAWGELSSPASRNVHGLFQRYRPESSPGRPALTVNGFGQGEAYYVAARTEADFLSAFYGALIDRLELAPALDAELPEGVSAQLRSSTAIRESTPRLVKG